MHFFLCFIRILFEKLMIQKFPYIYSLKRILLQTFIEEVSRLSRDVNIRWNLYFIFYNLDKFLFLGNFEGVLTNKHLIHHYSLIKNRTYRETRYQSFRHIIYPWEFKDKHKVEFHKKWFSFCCLDAHSIQNRTI